METSKKESEEVFENIGVSTEIAKRKIKEISKKNPIMFPS